MQHFKLFSSYSLTLGKNKLERLCTSNAWNLASADGTVVEHSTHKLNVKGSSTGEENNKKVMLGAEWSNFQ